MVEPEHPTGGQGWYASRGDARRAEREAHRARRLARRQRGDRAAGLVVGLLLILIGGYVLARQYAPQLDVDMAWPYVAVIFGVVLVLGSVRFRS